MPPKRQKKSTPFESPADDDELAMDYGADDDLTAKVAQHSTGNDDEAQSSISRGESPLSLECSVFAVCLHSVLLMLCFLPIK